MSALNKVMILGRVGRDPELKQTKSDTALTVFSVATTESYKDRAGNKKEETEWHKIVCWGKTAEIVAKYLHKGDLVYVEGKIHTDSYEKDGEKRYQTQIVARDVKFLTPKNRGGDSSANAPRGNASRARDDDSIPF